MNGGVKFGILGVGKMGSATLGGVLASGAFKKEDILFFDYDENAKAKHVALGITLAQSEKDLLDRSDVMLIAIKPQSFSAVEALSGCDASSKAIISFAPGKRISYLESIFQGALIVRAMPNTPALVCSAAATLFSNGKGDLRLLEYVKRIFSSIGTYEFLDREEDIDMAIPINGSMPAYVFSFIREFVGRAVEKGIDRQVALNLCISSIVGSCKLLQSSDEDLDTLIRNVCSKGGTTIAGLDKLYENGFKEAIVSCYDACSNRSVELGS